MSVLNNTCTPRALHTADEDDSVDANQSNVQHDSLPTGLPPNPGGQSPPALPPLEDEAEEACVEDIIIAIMGATGSGKSSFVDKVVRGGMGEGVGHDLTSFTREVKVTKRTIEGSNVVLVDTPGFDDTRMSDLDVLKIISDWLNAEYREGTMLSAVLYFHRITDNRMAGTPLKNLKVFEKLCGYIAMPKIVLVTTMWDEVDYDVGEERLKELRDNYWKQMIQKGSKTFKYKNTQESAMQLIHSVVHSQQETRKGVQLQVEISDLGFELRETAAAQVLLNNLQSLAARRMEVLRKIREETHRPNADLDVLRGEYEEIKAQLDFNLAQARELRQTKLQRFWRGVQRVLRFNSARAIKTPMPLS